MKVATWNVNSIRTRIEHVMTWLQDHPVDILCLQETKVTDAAFPIDRFSSIGYQAYIHGQKSYNGVALISRQELQMVRRGFGDVLGADVVGDLDDQSRVISGCLDGICVVNLYVPNGSSVGSEKYGYKLRWLACLQKYLQELLNQHAHLNVCGDFNIALDDRDIYNPRGKETHIMASPEERNSLRAVLAVGLVDAFRLFHEEGGHFSWWDYRAASFRRNLGWRIDHHYLSESLADLATGCWIDATPRGWEKPSDHTPVIVEYDLASLNS